MFRWKVVYYYCLKSGTKWLGINNHDGPFSTLLHIGHMTDGSLIWTMCNIPTLYHKGKKKRSYCDVGEFSWLFWSKLTFTHLGRVFPTGGDAPSPYQPKIYATTHKKFIFGCSHCTCTIFILNAYSLNKQPIPIWRTLVRGMPGLALSHSSSAIHTT